jgi:Immunoglobulin-like domain of bacterial spore germination
MSRPDQPTNLQPLPEPGEDAVATLLAEVLSSEARRIDPTDRLADIRTATAKRRRSWGPVAAGAAAVVLIGGGAWAVVDRTGPDNRRPSIAASPSPSATPTPTPSQTPSTGPTTSSGTWAAPIYYLGRNVTGLFREFHPLPVTPGPVVSHIEDALKVALDPSSPNRAADHLSPGLVGTSRSFQVGLAAGSDTIVITLPAAETTSRGATSQQARLAAQQLVWTATAVAQDAQLGVRITFVGGKGKLFGVLTTDQVFHRPSAALTYEDLSAIWVLSPDDGAVVKSSLVVSGQACTFEAALAWQLLRGSTVVSSGHTQTAQACPVRGSWSVPLRGLAAGDYTFRAYAYSPKDGRSYEGLDTTSFTVR